MPKPKHRRPFGLPRHWRCLIRQHFSTSLKPCLRHFSLLEGNTSFLAGRLHPERGRRLVELQLLRSIAWKRRSSGSIVPQPPRRAPKPKSSPKYAATSLKVLLSKLADTPRPRDDRGARRDRQDLAQAVTIAPSPLGGEGGRGRP